MFLGTIRAQNINGKAFTFREGNNGWSDTIYKKLLTKKMSEKGVKPVLLGIRYKLDKKVEEGKWYKLEITNKSNDTKVKFNVSSKHNQEIYSVRLNPGQTKVLEKLYWKRSSADANTQPENDEDEYHDLFFDENIETR